MVNYDVMDSCVSSCSSGISMCYKCGFELGHSLSAPVGLLWGFCGPPWPTWMWCYDVSICNAEALHFCGILLCAEALQVQVNVMQKLYILWNFMVWVNVMAKHYR